MSDTISSYGMELDELTHVLEAFLSHVRHSGSELDGTRTLLEQARSRVPERVEACRTDLAGLGQGLESHHRSLAGQREQLAQAQHSFTDHVSRGRTGLDGAKTAALSQLTTHLAACDGAAKEVGGFATGVDTAGSAQNKLCTRTQEEYEKDFKLCNDLTVQLDAQGRKRWQDLEAREKGAAGRSEHCRKQLDSAPNETLEPAFKAAREALIEVQTALEQVCKAEGRDWARLLEELTREFQRHYDRLFQEFQKGLGQLNTAHVEFNDSVKTVLASQVNQGLVQAQAHVTASHTTILAALDKSQRLAGQFPPMATNQAFLQYLLSQPGGAR